MNIKTSIPSGFPASSRDDKIIFKGKRRRILKWIESTDKLKPSFAVRACIGRRSVI
jgi:hypothetical protein